MEILVDRKYRKEGYTIGCAYIDGEYFSNTMEDKDRGLQQNMPLDEILKRKVYGETAIPTGRYKITLTYSGKFANKAWAVPYGGRVPEVNNVPGYSGVRLHPLNCAKDSLGCIGFGKNDKKGWISQSTLHFQRLMDKYLMPAWERGEEVWLTIK